MKKVICSILTVFILFLLQTSIFKYFSLGGIVPNLLLIVISIYGFMRGEKSGLIAGFFCGLLNDIFFRDFIGYYTLLYMFIGYFNGKLNEYYFPEDIIIPIGSITISDLIISFFNYVFLFLLNGKFDFYYYFIHVILAELIYTLGLFIILYPLLRLLEIKFIDKATNYEEKSSQNSLLTEGNNQEKIN